jgi:nucleoside-diphosphate-sugar epimerase
MSDRPAGRVVEPVLVTGADGFVGRVLCRSLVARGVGVRAAVRIAREIPGTVPGGPHPTEVVAVGDIGPDTDWGKALVGCRAVIHLAARVHVLREQSADPLAEFRRVNSAGTRRLAEAAVAAGVERFVFVSTVKVHGEASPGRPLLETDPLKPSDPYAVSKCEAEQALAEVCGQSSMRLTILRPPLVYGPGVGGNFARLLRAVDRGVPLPFGAFRNRRSLVYVENLADAIWTPIAERVTTGGTYLVSDGEDVSTPELVRRLAAALERPARLVSVPIWLLRAGAGTLGRARDFDRLAGDLAVDSGAIRRAFSWKAPVSLSSGLAATARWYRSSRE